MKITINEKNVDIVSKENWKYGEVTNVQVKELNPELYEQIQKDVNYAVDNEELVKEQQRLEAEKKRIEELTRRIEVFKDSILNNPEIMKVVDEEKLDLYFANPESNGYINPRTINIKTLKKDIYINCSIEYNDKVYNSSSSFYASKTNRVWELHFDYKRTRYVDLAKAIKKAAEKINEKITIKENNEKAANKETFQENEMKKFAESNGFKFEKEYHRSKYNNGWYTYEMIKEDEIGKLTIKARIVYNETDERVKIIKYTVSKRNGEITIDELNEVKVE
jgi:hypothetical protein